MTEDDIDEESLRRLRLATEKLPRDVEPPLEAWTAIKAEIGKTSLPLARRAGRAPAFWQRPVFLAAAAMLLVAGSSALTAIALSRRQEGATGLDRGPRSISAEMRSSTDKPSGTGSPATLAEFTLVENDYISTASRLSELLESKDLQLAPETIAKLKESLSVIDAAILEARSALAADPANKELIEMLSTSYNQKVDLLKRTTEMGRS